MRLFPSMTLAALALALLPAAVAAGAPQDRASSGPMAPVATVSTDPMAGAIFTFRDGRVTLLVEELKRSSPTAARMLRTLRDFGIPVVFGTIDAVLDDVRHEHRGYDPGRKKALGFMAPAVRSAADGDGLRTSSIVIGVDLGRMEHLFDLARGIPRPADVSWDEIERLETLALLGHELVHAYGLAVADGDPRRGCMDPVAGEPPRLSCVVQGENLIRRELGAPVDWGYGLAPLAELPARYQDLREHHAALRSVAIRTGAIMREGLAGRVAGP